MNGLKVYSWGDTTGYAVAGKAYVAALTRAGVNLTWHPMMPTPTGYGVVDVPSSPFEEFAPWFKRDIEVDTVLIHSVPEFYGPILEVERAAGRRVFGYTVWELEELPAHWVPILNSLDGVLVPCTWNVEVFQRSGVTVPIHVVPHLSQFEFLGEADDAAHDSLRRRLSWEPNRPKRRVFYTVGYYSHRKAPYLVVDAFLKAFTADDDVELIVKTSRRDITAGYRRTWRSPIRRVEVSSVTSVEERFRGYRNRPPVTVLAQEDLTDAEMLALHELGDVYVSLARTEGWGLGAFEAARLGTPVVMTGYGGQLDFLDPEFSSLVDYDPVPVYEPTWAANYKDSDMWTLPRVEHAAELMREIHRDPDGAESKAKQQAQRIGRDFGPEAVVEALLKALV